MNKRKGEKRKEKTKSHTYKQYIHTLDPSFAWWQFLNLDRNQGPNTTVARPSQDQSCWSLVCRLSLHISVCGS